MVGLLLLLVLLLVDPRLLWQLLVLKLHMELLLPMLLLVGARIGVLLLLLHTRLMLVMHRMAVVMRQRLLMLLALVEPGQRELCSRRGGHDRTHPRHPATVALQSTAAHSRVVPLERLVRVRRRCVLPAQAPLVVGMVLGRTVRRMDVRSDTGGVRSMPRESLVRLWLLCPRVGM